MRMTRTGARAPRTRTGFAIFVVLAVVLVSACASGTPATTAAAPAGSTPPATSQATAASSGPPTQTSEGGQVTVVVTWQGRQAGPVFSVTLDTHSVDLDSLDLGQLAVLRTDTGVEVRPSGWDAPNGGHHRSGTLAFPASGPDGRPLLGEGTRSVELAIRDVAGVPERTFQWTL